MREYAKDEKQAELLVRNVGNAVMKLKELTDKEDEYPLAVLAAEITDNPHYFDRSTTAGLLLYMQSAAAKIWNCPKTHISGGNC